ncbi:signal peptidase I [Leptobacterium flavescens]|uniref:Signal peptidase I n=1 Tax=Leptobacterium flavescens TaxID=472055 RepID=A0A6P0UP58_9FLAO|nr:signal peptidase I [Leptobacterium flavescens]NER12136.1 signal peptidase I [Leptobacterium flavescens]
MTMTQWLIFFIVIQIVHFLGTWKLYVKAGRKAWEAIVPIYNAIVLMQIINRPKWWVILLFIPIINLIMFPVIWVETIRSFGRNSRNDTILVILTLGFYIFYVNYALDVNYIEDRSLKPRTNTGEWVSSILFAIVAATMVHTYFMQPYVIPTSSLEKTLLVGDFLFVSKFHYGARTPMTTVAAPMVHDTIPVAKIKSYTNKPQLPYFRLPGFQNIKRNEIVVFSWPTDTVRFFRDRSNIHIQKPIDKKSNYVKRCVGIAGDSLELRDGYVYINGKRSDLPDRAKLQFSYSATTNGQTNYSSQYLYDRYDVNPGEGGMVSNNQLEFISLSEAAADRLQNNPSIIDVQRNISPKGSYDPRIFPHSNNFNWNQDNFGPIYIPQAGKSVALDLEVLPLYSRIIEEYEGNTLRVEGNQIFINDQLADSYTFKQDYYWMMGDNRHNSEDSRYWGYVPYDHVVGKPVFIWMSWDSNANGIMNKIRWERLFTTVGGEGKPVSYFKYFVILLGGWFLFSYIRKKRKKA